MRALSFTMISIGQYKNSSYFKYCLHVNIFVTHDELYFTKHLQLYMYILKGKVSHTRSHTNKQIKQQQQPQGIIYGASYKQ